MSNGTYATMADSHVIVDGQRYDNINGLEMGEGWLVLSVYISTDGKNQTVDQFLQPLLVAKSFAVKVGEDEDAPVLSAAYENMALVSRSYEVSQQPARREQAEDNRRAGTGCIWVCRLRYEDSRAIRTEAWAIPTPPGYVVRHSQIEPESTTMPAARLPRPENMHGFSDQFPGSDDPSVKPGSW